MERVTTFRCYSAKCRRSTKATRSQGSHNNPRRKLMAAPRPEEKPSETRQQKSASQSTQESGRVISDATSRFARNAAEVSERASQIGLEMVQQNNETAQQEWEASTDIPTRLRGGSANQFGLVFRLSG